MHHTNILKILCFVAFQVFFIFLQYSTAFSGDGLKWGRFRFTPELSVSEVYTDNVYIAPTDEQSDTVTTISPKLLIDFALAPMNYITFSYSGDYRIYANSDNFKTDVHRTSLFWSLTTPKGSTFKLGVKADFDSIQPYSVRDRHKDYEETEAYADMLLALGAFSNMGIRYGHLSQRFNDPHYAVDEFDRDTITLKAAYKRLPATTPFIEYTFYHQDNNDLFAPSTDMNVQFLLIGTQWEPTAKLSGYLKGGYYQAKLENGDDSSGLAVDTNVAYQVSDSTQLRLTLFRRLVKSMRAARETGDYYVSTGGDFSVSYRRWEPLTMTMNVSYQNNKFKQKTLLDEHRTDNYYSAGINLKYSPRDWLSFGLTYQYRVNNTNFNAAEFRENRIQASVSFAL
jgi:hypothetical protein